MDVGGGDREDVGETPGDSEEDVPRVSSAGAVLGLDDMGLGSRLEPVWWCNHQNHFPSGERRGGGCKRRKCGCLGFGYLLGIMVGV